MVERPLAGANVGKAELRLVMEPVETRCALQNRPLASDHQAIFAEDFDLTAGLPEYPRFVLAAKTSRLPRLDAADDHSKVFAQSWEELLDQFPPI